MIIVISVLAPSFTRVSGNVLRLYPDGGITLDCKAFGIPKPTVQWTRSLMPLPQERSEELDGGLVISDMQEQDSGNYTCTASNAVGVINATTELLLRGKTSMLLKGSTPERNAILAVVGFHSVKVCPCLPKKLSSDGRTRWFSKTTLDTNRSSMSTWNPWKLGESSGSGASGRLNTCTVPGLFTTLVTRKVRLWRWSGLKTMCLEATPIRAGMEVSAVRPDYTHHYYMTMTCLICLPRCWFDVLFCLRAWIRHQFLAKNTLPYSRGHM